MSGLISSSLLRVTPNCSVQASWLEALSYGTGGRSLGAQTLVSFPACRLGTGPASSPGLLLPTPVQILSWHLRPDSAGCCPLPGHQLLLPSPTYREWLEATVVTVCMLPCKFEHVIWDQPTDVSPPAVPSSPNVSAASLPPSWKSGQLTSPTKSLVKKVILPLDSVQLFHCQVPIPPLLGPGVGLAPAASMASSQEGPFRLLLKTHTC